MRTLKELERDYIVQTMKMCKNNKAMVSRVLGISPRTLYNKLDIYQVTCWEQADFSPVTSNTGEPEVKYIDREIIKWKDGASMVEFCNVVYEKILMRDTLKTTMEKLRMDIPEQYKLYKWIYKLLSEEARSELVENIESNNTVNYVQ